jgi:hypothetical protein
VHEELVVVVVDVDVVVVVVVEGVVVVAVVVGGGIVTIGVASEVAIAAPFLFVAVTIARNVQPASAFVTTCALATSPASDVQAAPEVSQRAH